MTKWKGFIVCVINSILAEVVSIQLYPSPCSPELTIFCLIFTGETSAISEC